MTTQWTQSLGHLDWSRLQLSLAWAIEHRQVDLKRLRGVTQWYASLWVKEGTMQVQAGKESVEVKAGEWLFLLPCKRVVDIPRGTVYCSVAFHAQWAGEGELVHPMLRLLVKSGALPDLEDKTNRLCKEMYSAEDLSRQWRFVQARKYSGREHLHLRYHFHDWLCHWVEAMESLGMGWRLIRSMDRRMVGALSYLREQPWREPINWEYLAREMGVSVRQFFRVFRSQFGMTPKAWREQWQLEEALRLLSETDRKVQDIAASFGLSPSHFGVWIRQQTGKTPREYRRGQT
jgi:AraC-like DNA-binding protein